MKCDDCLNLLEMYIDGEAGGVAVALVDVSQVRITDGASVGGDPLNAVIFDLDKAPRNSNGRVEYTTEFLILRPVDMRKGNGKIFYGINNRGNTGALGGLNDATTGGNDPTTAQDAGNGFLMRQGYAVVDAGWEGDVLQGNFRLAAQFPTVTDNGATIHQWSCVSDNDWNQRWRFLAV